MPRIILSLIALSLCHFQSFGQIDFATFIGEITEQAKISTASAKRYLKVPAIENQDEIGNIELDSYNKHEAFHGISFALKNEQGCEIGYYVTLDDLGQILDQIMITNVCDIDLSLQQYESSEGSVSEEFIEILQTEEAVLDLADTSATLDNSETKLLVYIRYVEIAADGYLTELSIPKEVNDLRDYPFVSQELVSTEDLSEYSKNQLRWIRAEVLASYGHIFENETLQEHYEKTDWYQPIGDATDKVTDVEKRNISLIEQLLLR